MSIPRFFAEPARAEKLRSEVAEWLGTPFVHYAKVKGGGVDCVHLVGEILRICGVAETYDFGRYSLDRSQHQCDSLVRRWLDSMPNLGSYLPESEEPPAELALGDVVLWRMGMTSHHIGIVVDPPVFVHCFLRANVTHGDLRCSTWRNLYAGAWRPIPH